MNEVIHQRYPLQLSLIEKETKQSGFTMASEPLTGTLLRTLAGSKRGGAFLELGTGTGLSTAWILDGMDARSTLISVDNDPTVQDIASRYLGTDPRLSLVLSDGAAWLQSNQHRRFDFIFADTWHGKYLLLNEALSLLNPGGLYVIDDMLPQPNWPDGHSQKVDKLIEELEQRSDLLLTTLHWATGIIVAVKVR